MSGVRRTPDERFDDLPDYDFTPHWHEWDGLRLHYLDEGAGPAVVMFHGEPTWSFLYRKVLRPVVAAGYRVIAPDYAGFGRSDKPTEPAFYTYDNHVAAMTSLLASLGLSGATAVVQDWGGPIGLRIAVEHPEWFSRLSILNTFVPDGTWRMNDAWRTFRDFVERTPDLPVGMLMERSQAYPWGEDVIAGYEAPFADADHKVGAWRFPLIVPLADGDPGAGEMLEVGRRLGQWDGPAQVLFSTGDPIFSTRVGEKLVALIPGAGELETIDGAGHFLQEDEGEEVGRRIAAFLTAH